jgi:hypothetical protein
MVKNDDIDMLRFLNTCGLKIKQDTFAEEEILRYGTPFYVYFKPKFSLIKRIFSLSDRV